MDRQTFLANLRRSGLVTEGELARLLPRLPAGDAADAVASGLVGLGVITRFQAERLLTGRAAGFLLGEYRILDQLGRGAMGRVFKAEHRIMGRLVALKVLAPQLLKTERARDLFHREVRAFARLVHPNIVTAYDASASANRYYLVLELVDGPNLDQLVRGEGPLAVDQACEYVRQVADGLQCAHALGMVHRDIKPANLLLQRPGRDGDSPGVIKISDFGLARLHHPDSPADSDGFGTIIAKANTVMGTPDFLSPEQSRCLHRADIRSDLYSLGCTFYFLLTGQVPFPGGTTLDKLIRHTTDAPRPLVELRPDVPTRVADVVHKLLAKSPDDRFQTPAELAATLAPFAVNGPIHWQAPPVPAASDTESPGHEGTVGSRSEFDIATGEFDAPRSPSRLLAGGSPANFFGKTLRLVRKAFGK
jgi:serine/threonine-protein kinase